MLKPKPYIKLASAELADCRIERIFIKARLSEAIRLSDWRGGRFNRRALAMPEQELLVLLGDAIAAGVCSHSFITELESILDAQAPKAYPKKGNGRRKRQATQTKS